jgi:4-hydroxyphenylpyruvate dioxygenase
MNQISRACIGRLPKHSLRVMQGLRAWHKSLGAVSRGSGRRPNVKLSIATVCLSGGLDEKLHAIAASGLKGVEIFENDLLSFHGTPEDVRRMAGDLGLEIVAFQPFRDFEGLPPEKRERAFARAERKFDLMAELGCKLMLICSNVAPDSLGGIERAAGDLRALGERAAKRGFKVGFEALSWGRHIHDYRDSWEVVRRAEHPAIGLVLDSFHIGARKTDMSAIRNIPADKIFLVQLADAPMLNLDYLTWGRHYRNFPGQGEMPIQEFMEALDVTGFDGILSLEIFNDQFRAGSAKSVAIDGHRSLLFAMDKLAEKSNRRPAGAVVMPPRSPCSGTAFIEFAIDKASGPAFDAVLSSLGFSVAGRHRSKAVTRWQQGAINIVVNTDARGFAHNFSVTHGAGVCAIGLSVDDAHATLDRARQLLDQPFSQAIGPGELEVPAVRSLGGSLIYFVDQKTDLARIWDIEFEAVRQPTQYSPAGLTVVDHISQSMHYEEMLSWLLFYTSLLDLAKLPEATVLDPGGVVKSQVIQSAQGELRLVLNASQSVRTLSSRFLSEAFGSGVQHIAFATDDIFATAARLKSNGVSLLAISENYYDDLETKTELSLDDIDRLKAHNTLYERDGNGEYFQIYTQTFDERFFFEIVERRGGYQGLGATNAQIRLSAQSRAARNPAIPRL